MIKPYMAVGLIPTVRGIRKRSDIKLNLEHLAHLTKAAAWLLAKPKLAKAATRRNSSSASSAGMSTDAAARPSGGSSTPCAPPI